MWRREVSQRTCACCNLTAVVVDGSVFNRQAWCRCDLSRNLGRAPPASGCRCWPNTADSGEVVRFQVHTLACCCLSEDNLISHTPVMHFAPRLREYGVCRMASSNGTCRIQEDRRRAFFFNMRAQNLDHSLQYCEQQLGMQLNQRLCNTVTSPRLRL